MKLLFSLYQEKKCIAPIKLPHILQMLKQFSHNLSDNFGNLANISTTVLSFISPILLSFDGFTVVISI